MRACVRECMFTLRWSMHPSVEKVSDKQIGVRLTNQSEVTLQDAVPAAFTA